MGKLVASYVAICIVLSHPAQCLFSELQAARDDKHLYRAVLRAVQKPLSVLLSNLSALLLPLLSSPAFLQPPVPTFQMPNPNATQLHALGIADFAGELLSTFDDTALGIETDSRGDGLQPIRAGLVSLIGGTDPTLDALEIPGKTTPHKAKESVHPSITALQSSVPVYGRALARYATTYHSDTLLASFLISIVWRALVALSHRPMMTQALHRVLSPTGLFNLKRGSSRSASLVTPSTAVADAKALCEIFSQFPRPTHTQAAREAVEEAFAHLETLMSLLEIAGDPFFVVNRTAEEIADEIHSLTDQLPTLIALPVLLRVQYFGGVLEPQVNTVAAFLNIPEDVYRKDCLAGFGRAEQWGPVLAQRILDEIYAGPVVDSSTCFVDWLEDRLGQNDD
ncbi:hypothetical protein JVT61DRAFT_3004 [Boletus reticuloceps]|uniref:Uncharacterized protein n=1 Tax=Boletus reticuloceps TaxID=495285 RepID=A0A8I2YNY0_9AGAM|nr:hypothetical protein JVT61DRAFT_3004 [Boletus reticuloceps]